MIYILYYFQNSVGQNSVGYMSYKSSINNLISSVSNLIFKIKTLNIKQLIFCKY